MCAYPLEPIKHQEIDEKQTLYYTQNNKHLPTLRTGASQWNQPRFIGKSQHHLKAHFEHIFCFFYKAATSFSDELCDTNYSRNSVRTKPTAAQWTKAAMRQRWWKTMEQYNKMTNKSSKDDCKRKTALENEHYRELNHCHFKGTRPKWRTECTYFLTILRSSQCFRASPNGIEMRWVQVTWHCDHINWSMCTSINTSNNELE